MIPKAVTRGSPITKLAFMTPGIVPAVTALNLFSLGFAQEAGPPVKPDRLGSRGQASSGDCKLRVTTRVNDPFRRRPESIDGFVARVRIQEALAET